MNDSTIYTKLIIRGERTINDVPTRVRGEVIRLLKSVGYESLLNSETKYTDK